MKSLPPLTWFRSFEAAARHLSFTAAAEEIGLTQSAVSQQVKALESRLNVALFVRQPRGLSLTDDGRRLLPQVGAGLETLLHAAETFTGGAKDGVLTIATSVSLAQWVIAPRLTEFTERHPSLQLRFISAIWPDDFQAPRVDVEIRFGSEKQVGNGAQLLEPNRLIAVKSPTLSAPLDDLPLIEAVGTSAGWSAWSEAHGGQHKPQYFADNYGMALELAAHGNGVALVSEVLAGQAIKQGQVVRAHDGAIPAQEGYYLWAREGRGDAALFRDWLLEVLN
ncbi:LysR family transcriptional regulator [Cognatiyoonia sp.]|uniref:LysR family transcriptional regulator n=1 Tax=Cognatiyoonia sp. TaxID=2211652 RepID=UPI003F6A12C3